MLVKFKTQDIFHSKKYLYYYKFYVFALFNLSNSKRLTFSCVDYCSLLSTFFACLVLLQLNTLTLNYTFITNHSFWPKLSLSIIVFQQSFQNTEIMYILLLIWLDREAIVFSLHFQIDPNIKLRNKDVIQLIPNTIFTFTNKPKQEHVLFNLHRFAR